jgi:hypothetical protein
MICTACRLYQKCVQVTWEENIKLCCSLDMQPLLGNAPYEQYLYINSTPIGETFSNFSNAKK